jgi:hypothetical protein
MAHHPEINPMTLHGQRIHTLNHVMCWSTDGVAGDDIMWSKKNTLRASVRLQVAFFLGRNVWKCQLMCGDGSQTTPHVGHRHESCPKQ